MNYELYLLAIAGVLVHYWKEWVIASKASKEYDFKKVVPMGSLSVFTSIILVYLRKDIEDLYVITKFGALILGYMGNSIFFSFVDVKKPKIAPEQQDSE